MLVWVANQPSNNVLSQKGERHRTLVHVCLLDKDMQYLSYATQVCLSVVTLERVCCSHTKEEIDMHLRQTSCYMLPSVCLLPHKRERQSYTSHNLLLTCYQCDHLMIQCLLQSKTCIVTITHLQADVLHDSCLQAIIINMDQTT